MADVECKNIGKATVGWETSLVCKHISYVYQHLHLPLVGRTLIPVEGSSIK